MKINGPRQEVLMRLCGKGSGITVRQAERLVETMLAKGYTDTNQPPTEEWMALTAAALVKPHVKVISCEGKVYQ